MDKNRLEAFSDGVIAIIITIMVLDLKVPQNPDWQSYLQAYPVFVSYAISFVFVGLFWISHHHLFRAVTKVNNKVLWLNMLSLFWLSLIPFATATMGNSSFSRLPVTVYALTLDMVPASYLLLVSQLYRIHGANSDFSRKYEGLLKSYVTIALNAVSAVIAFIGFPKVAFVMIALTAVMWFLPNFRVGSNHDQKNKPNEENNHYRSNR